MMLQVANLAVWYGRSQALFDVGFAVGAGEVVTLLGRNGAGKTTTIRAIMGLMARQQGSIAFSGASIAGLEPQLIARQGIGLVPEGRQVFPTLTVYENLIATSANRHHATHPWTLERVLALFPALRARQDQYAATLSGGEQQMLAIGRALLTNPKLLILDEATEGLAPVIRADIWRCIVTLKRAGQAILITDKNLAVLRGLADRHYVIEKGRTVWSGTSVNLDRDAAQVHRYVGV
jgi:branched-chain amino acid transport system ATP-binding protein